MFVNYTGGCVTYQLSITPILIAQEKHLAAQDVKKKKFLKIKRCRVLELASVGLCSGGCSIKTLYEGRVKLVLFLINQVMWGYQFC